LARTKGNKKAAAKMLNISRTTLIEKIKTLKRRKLLVADATDGQLNQGDEPKSYTRDEAWELDLLAICVWREARDQGFLGMCAVAWSIRNRVKKPGKTWWGDDWEEVILKPWQFTSMRKGDPNASLLPGDPKSDPSWANARIAAERAYLGMGVDVSQGATHYYNPKVVKVPPKWVTASDTRHILDIGDHRFYVAS
jgi:spore germination cell wall hydrolase CwlJ-like protein